MEDKKSIFWGSRKINSFTKLDHKTPAGSDVYKLVLDDGQIEFITKEAYIKFTTEKAVDDSSFRKMREKFINERLAGIILEYGVIYGDIEFLTESLKHKLYEAFNRADNLLWTGNDALWISGQTAIDNRSLLEAHCVLEGGKKDEQK